MHLRTRTIAALTCALLLGSAASAAAQESVIYRFKVGRDGWRPGDMIIDANGVLYGTTSSGTNTFCALCGTVFALTPPAAGQTDWVETVLHRFLATAVGGGRTPNGPIMDERGRLYGTTVEGGLPGCGRGCGLVFELSPPGLGNTLWSGATLYRFKGGKDGGQPTGLIMDAKGVLYGTTYTGGYVGGAPGTDCVGSGCGTVFALVPPAVGATRWTEQVLFRFHATDGAYPASDLLMDRAGNLYGTTEEGGVQNSGTVFELISPNLRGGRWTHSVLHKFTGGDDGSLPGGMIMDARGVLYGTTFGGGGTVFALTPPTGGETAWTETVLHNFARRTGDGNGPISGLLAGANGTLYGATVVGGSECNCGAVFALSPPAAGKTAWTERVLYRFAGGGDGAYPSGGRLVADANGVLYSTTFGGGGTGCGGGGCGTVYKLVP